MTKRKDIHERVLTAKSTEELMAAYGEWADIYDNDLLGEMDYVAPVNASKILFSHLESKDLKILDAGCGTGIVGGLLHEQGFTNIQGLDYSTHMLENASKKKVYKTLYQMDLTKPLTFADDSFDTIISVGTFTCGHVGPGAFKELIRITRPGGYICFTVREQAWEEDGYSARLRELEENGAWKLQEDHTADYIRQEGARCRICLYRVL